MPSIPWPAVFDASPLPAAITDHTGVVQHISAAGAACLSVEAPACSGKPLASLVSSSASRARISEAIQSLQKNPEEGNLSVTELIFGKRGQKKSFLSATLVPVPGEDGKASHILWSFEPVSSPGELESAGDRGERGDAAALERQKSEASELLGLRRLVSALIEHLPVGMLFLTGSDFCIQWANSRASEMLGIGMENLRKQRFCDAFPSAIESKLEERIRAASKSGKLNQDLDFTYRRNGKESGYWQVLAVPIPTDDSGRNSILLLLMDIGAQVRTRKAAEESAGDVEKERRLLESVLELLPVGLLIVDKDGGYLRSNAARARIWGGFEPASSVLDYRHYRGWFTRNGRSIRPEEWPIARAARNGSEIINEELEIERFGGGRRTVLCSAIPIRDVQGRILGGLSVMEDVTEQKQAERELEWQKQKAERLASDRLIAIERTNRLISISQSLLAETTISGLLERMADVACELARARVGLSGYGFADGVFRRGVLARTGKSYRHMREGSFSLKEGAAYEELIRRKRPFRFHENELRTEEPVEMPQGGQVVRGGLMGCPLIGKEGALVGAILVSDRIEGQFSEFDEILLSEFCAIASLSLQLIESAMEARQRADELDAIFAALNDIIVIYDAEGTAIQANPAAIEAFGYNPVGFSRDALTEKLQTRHLDGTPVEMDKIPSSIALQGVPVCNLHYLITDAVGRTITVQVSGAPIWSGNRVVAAVCALRDVTERENLLRDLQVERLIAEERARDAEEARRIFEGILENVPEGVGIADAESLRMKHISRHGLEMLGLLADQVRDTTIGDIARLTPTFEPGGEPVSVEGLPMVRAIREGRRIVDEEWRVKTADGRSLWVLCSCAPLEDREGRITDGILVWRNITERRQAEESLRLLSTALQASNSDLLHFAHTISHDLREPLRGLLCHLQVLETSHGQRLDSASREVLHFAMQSGRQMSEMIDGLLEYARIGRPGRALGWIDSGLALEKALLNLRQFILETNAEITHGSLPRIQADDVQLTQLFQNLLDNALRFHGAGRPQVVVAAKETGIEWIFTVADNGVGIDSKYQEKVYDFFQRLNIPESYGGGGIGLAICRRIIERHGGRIWVEPKPGEGATVCFSIPKRADAKDKETQGV